MFAEFRSPAVNRLRLPVQARSGVHRRAAPFQDRVIQELLLLLLEPVFELRFSPKSHAFRPGRAPHRHPLRPLQLCRLPLVRLHQPHRGGRRPLVEHHPVMPLEGCLRPKGALLAQVGAQRPRPAWVCAATREEPRWASQEEAQEKGAQEEREEEGA
jgi:hypothetical protein